MEKKRVLPGDFVSTEEEFEPGPNTFASDGEVLSDSIGTVVEDTRQKTVAVEKTKEIVPAKVGDIVLGVVILVKDNSVSLSIFVEPDGHSRKVLSRTSAALPVRMVSRSYVENLKALFKIGDFVKARIAKNLSYGIDVKTDEPELGVVKAFCSECRKPLQLFGNSLKCLSCGRTEERKISSDYYLR